VRRTLEALARKISEPPYLQPYYAERFLKLGISSKSRRPFHPGTAGKRTSHVRTRLIVCIALMVAAGPREGE
jgi:hypothetical protein